MAILKGILKAIYYGLVIVGIFVLIDTIAKLFFN
jgi:TM2 domain-containing membrane protein YozV